MCRGKKIGLRGLGATLTACLAIVVFPSAICDVAFGARDVNMDSCPLASETSPGFRTYLPDCRAYELVSPPYKAGAPLTEEPAAVSIDGEHVIVGAPGAFAGDGNLWVQLNRNPNVAVYEFSRGNSGWSPEALTPAATRYPYSTMLAAAATDNLATTLWGATSNTQRFKEDLYLREPGGGFVSVGPGYGPEVAGQELSRSAAELGLAGASADLSHLLFGITAEGQAGGHGNLWPGDKTQEGSRSLYEYVGTGNSAPALVGVSDGATAVNGITLPAGTQISRCGTEVGSGLSGSAYNAVSSDGETVIFTARACGLGAGEPPVDELYARLGDSKTVKISEPSSGDCSACRTSPGETELKGAIFQGASSDGRTVVFLTTQELLPGQKGANLYKYDFSAPEHRKVALVSMGAAEPEVQGVVRVSMDGSRVYFVAKGVLTNGANAEGREPEPGADNLYVYGPDPKNVGASHVVFVATLLRKVDEATLEQEEEAERYAVSGRAEEAGLSAFYEAISKGASFEEGFFKFNEVYVREQNALSGTLGPGGTLGEDRRVWSAEDARPVQTTVDGHFLVFLSSAKLTPDDTSPVPQLFEYDAQAERLTRISIGQDGIYANDGNVSVFHAAPQIPVQRFTGRDLPTESDLHLALSSDGTRVLFTSAAELAPGAVSGQPSVFEYNAGNVRLVSDGKDTSVTNEGPAVQLYGFAAGTEPQLRDVFFTTADALVPQDGESQISLYDARIDGGFPASSSALLCSGEECRGSAALTPALPGATSASAVAGEESIDKPDAKKVVAKRHRKAKRRRRRRTRVRIRHHQRRVRGGSR